MFPHPTSEDRLLVVVAHPDDESFGCGSAILLAGEAGAHTTVVCATRGEAGEASPLVADDLATWDLGTLRERELRASARVLDVARVDLWAFADSGMSGPPPPDSLAATPARDLAQAVSRVVEDVRPTALMTLDASDGHRDHVAVRAAVEDIGRDGDIPTYLSCLPRSLMRRWAEHVARTQQDNAYLALGELGTPDEDLTVTLDARRHRPRRDEAIATHRSQTSPFEGLPDDLRHAFLDQVHLQLFRSG